MLHARAVALRDFSGSVVPQTFKWECDRVTKVNDVMGKKKFNKTKTRGGGGGGQQKYIRFIQKNINK